MDHPLDQEILLASGGGSPDAQAPPAAADDVGMLPVASSFPTSFNSSHSADKPARAYWIWAVCGSLVLAVGLVFGQTLGHEFVGFDDDAFVCENTHVTPGLTLPGIWWALTDGTFGEWCPLSTLSHMLDCELYGLNPAGHYLTNVLLHAASSVLLFLVLLRMTGDLWPSAWVAAVFAIHPLHVESVAWVAERRDVLSGLFFMLTLGAYTLYAERPSPARYLAVAGLFALGLMAKPILVTVPFLLLLLDYWPLDRFRQGAGARPTARSGSWFGRLPVGWRLVVEKIPLIALATVTCGIVILTHSSTRSTNPFERLPLATRLANALVSYATYLIQSVFPVDLAAFYPHPGTHLSTGSVVGSLVLLMAITAVAACWWRRRPYVLVGWLWFSGTLVPVSGLVQLGAIARADRYTYLSQIGLSIALAWGVWRVHQYRQSRGAIPRRQWTLAVVSGAVVLVLAAVAWRQTTYWRNAETLWTHALACTTNNLMAQYNLSYTYFLQGRIDEATPHAREAAAVESVDRAMVAKSESFLGDCLTKQGNDDEALAHFEKAVLIEPAALIFHQRLAKALACRGRHDRAVIEWREVLRLDPAFLPGHLELANSLLASGDAPQAIAECRVVLKEIPNLTEAFVTQGAALAAEGKDEEAISSLKQALAYEPNNARARFHLGLILYGRGRSADAAEHLEKAVRFQPDNVEMLWQTAWILATDADPAVRDGARAVKLATKAVELSDGKEVRPLDALAAALAETEKFSAAVDTAERASAMALVHSDAALVEAIDQRTRLYRQDLPYRQPAAHVPPESTPPEAAN